MQHANISKCINDLHTVCIVSATSQVSQYHCIRNDLPNPLKFLALKFVWIESIIINRYVYDTCSISNLFGGSDTVKYAEMGLSESQTYMKHIKRMRALPSDTQFTLSATSSFLHYLALSIYLQLRMKMTFNSR